jgi:arylsulfatase A-like enzyme
MAVRAGRRVVVRAWVAALVAPVALSAAAAPPNVVVCIADDVSYGDFGCNGNPDVRTPRIDGLAADGVRFTNAYLTASSCSPSRLSILTGRYPHNNGAACELHRPLPAHIPTLPDLLQRAGYFTALAGKHHVPRAGLPDTAGWNVVRSTRQPGASGGEEEWLATLRDRPADVPFFLWLASVDAHRGWLAAVEWSESRYGPRHDPGSLAVPPWMPDTPAARADLTCYYDEITRFDWYVGQVVDELERQGVLDETIVVVTADNGRPFPRGKTRLHDEGMKMPLVIRAPVAAGGRGVVCGATAAVCLQRAQLARLRGPRPGRPRRDWPALRPQLEAQAGLDRIGRLGGLADAPGSSQSS